MLKPWGDIGALEQADGFGGLAHQVGGSCVGELFELGLVGLGGDQQVAVGVGVAVDQHDACGRWSRGPVARGVLRRSTAVGGGAEEAGRASGLSIERM